MAWLIGIKVVSVVGSGLIAGAFFAFSAFVMSALARLPAPQGIAAMQSINSTVINPWFLGVFVGTAIVSLVLCLLSWTQVGPAVSLPVLIGGALYVLGTFGVTIACNVPLNEALAVVDPNSPEGAALWTRYVAQWTLWNHLRTAASLAASLAYLLSLLPRQTP
ncbi:MAG: anthrone oxygenase family protein [Capsulimonadales bacterium]|nr:anthrone oxygenase family protein [Capsulimonadales bacterium]